jgi:hypothetical protein
MLSLLALVMLAPCMALACGPAPAPPPSVPPTPPPPLPSASAAPAASSATAEVPAASASSAPAPSATADNVPCIDGEVLMGACICPSGKGVDATGHCVFMPCPKGNMGGVVFRSDSGQCMECKPGQVRCGDGCCAH